MRVRLFKEIILFLLAVTPVRVVMWICVESLPMPTSSADDRKWAIRDLSRSGGTIGYLVKK
ncbi:hypothetical protein [uncultured Paracoccus sp.]|uniref:hypothetical protein n=1 Tax=uncultured Paracoccus sp. TaxID=189685 RepID=UPI0025E7DCFB|nr:hypothetical protein [uncultured Paracoccus sp.]